MSPWCLLPPVEQMEELLAAAGRSRGSSESRLKLLLVPTRVRVDRGEAAEARAGGLSLFRRDSMEKGPLNFTSHLI